MENTEKKIRLELLDELINRYKRTKSSEYALFVEQMKSRKAGMSNDFGLADGDVKNTESEMRLVLQIPEWIFHQMNYILTHREQFLTPESQKYVTPALFLTTKDERIAVIKFLKEKHKEFFIPNKY